MYNKLIMQWFSIYFNLTEIPVFCGLDPEERNFLAFYLACTMVLFRQYVLGNIYRYCLSQHTGMAVFIIVKGPGFCYSGSLAGYNTSLRHLIPYYLSIKMCRVARSLVNADAWYFTEYISQAFDPEYEYKITSNRKKINLVKNDAT